MNLREVISGQPKWLLPAAKCLYEQGTPTFPLSLLAPKAPRVHPSPLVRRLARPCRSLLLAQPTSFRLAAVRDGAVGRYTSAVSATTLMPVVVEDPLAVAAASSLGAGVYLRDKWRKY